MPMVINNWKRITIELTNGGPLGLSISAKTKTGCPMRHFVDFVKPTKEETAGHVTHTKNLAAIGWLEKLEWSWSHFRHTRSAGAGTRVCGKAREGANAVDNFRRRQMFFGDIAFKKPFVISVRHEGDFSCGTRADSANWV